MTFRKVPTKTEGLNTTRRGGDFLADNARPCLSDRCPTFADSKDYLTAYRDAGNEKELRKRNGGTPSGTLTALPVHQMNGGTVVRGACPATLRSTQKKQTESTAFYR